MGITNDDVALVQEVLLFYGYYHGPIDSVYGTLTEQAIDLVRDDVLLSEDDSITNQEEVIDSNLQTEKKVLSDESDIVQLDVEKADISILEEAKSHIGTPYVWGGTNPEGFDCSGYIQYLFNEQNITIPRTVNEIWNFSTPISSPSLGDLVFFETYREGPSHLGLYIGGNQFIHAGTSNGVVISDMTEDYWDTKYIGAKRINQNKTG